MAGLRKDLLAVVGVGVPLRNGEVKVSRGRPVWQPRPAMQEVLWKDLALNTVLIETAFCVVFYSTVINITENKIFLALQPG